VIRVKVDVRDVNAVCSNCNVRGVCMPIEDAPDFLRKLDELVYVRKRIKSGTTLYHTGSKFHALYAVKSGFIKTENLHDDGRVQVTGFYMSGDVFGFDGIATDEHICTSIALEDTEICVIPLDRVERFNHGIDELQHHLYKLMSREIVRDHTVMMLIGSMNSEERLAAFILALSQRFLSRGYSPYHLTLRMKRDEIGSYLGMKVETVSRIFTKFQDLALLEVQQKNIHILDMPGLKKMLGQHPSN